MAKTKSKKPSAEQPASAPDSAEVIEDTAEGLEKLASSQLEMSKLFIARDRVDIATRRLREILELYPTTPSAQEAKTILKRI